MGLGSFIYSFVYISTILSVNVLILTNFVSSLQPSCSEHERLALLNFMRSFHIDCPLSSHSPFGPPKVKSWTFSDEKDCCFWDGVECDNKTGHVNSLDLSNSCLYGSFPPNSSLFGLSHLRYLDLSYNHFKFSQIPSQIGQLNNLKSLDLSNAAFSGQIPSDISKLSRLSNLYISYFHIPTYYSTPNLILHDPSIAKLVQNLTNLQVLVFNAVDMSSTFPTVLSNLTSLEMLIVQGCNLYGELPPKLFHLPRLEVLLLNGNFNLLGFLPEFQWHSPLRELSLTGTSLSGELPPSIGNLAYLEILGLGGCQFSGLLPSSLGNLTTLTSLILDHNRFQGGIPFSLINLTNLQVLYLSYLNVNPDHLFSQFLKQQNLIELHLTGMKLDSETLTLLANFTKLQSLKLDDTNLTGPFPKWLANLTQLNILSLNSNELFGLLPRWISQLNKLYVLRLAGTNLVGKFESFSNFQSLQLLDLSDSSIILPPISGKNASLIQLQFLGLAKCNLIEFPPFLKYQNQLNVLLLQLNNIRGSIPNWFVDITKDNLSVLDLSNNFLTGFEKPVVFLPWNNLEYIDISNNNFHGQFPIPKNSFKYYLASSNLFSGNIPNHICNATSLISLDLSSNMLSGQIPHCVATKLADSLEMLNLRSNCLNGNIPPAFTRSCKVKMINLSNNKLGGHLPRSLINCSMLEELDIGRNNINDTFPSWLGSLPKLQILVLNHNNIHGIIADLDSNHSFSMLRIIDVSYNLCSGDLPSGYFRNWHEMKVSMENQSDISNIVFNANIHVVSEVLVSQKSLDYYITITNKGNQRLYSKILKVLRVVDFSSNNFTGRIPDIIGSLQGLQALNLSNNSLNGRIPPALANISDLESLDLSRNKLSGVIPLALSQLTSLEVFNVSYNQLEGPIPTGNQFNTFDNSSFQGNLRLCGMPLSKKCVNVDSLQPPTHDHDNDNDNEDSKFIDWIIRSFGFLSGCVVGCIIGKLFITDKYHDWFMVTFGRLSLRKRVQRSPTHRR